jgi:aspartate/methionine/tyrosine aminotransferase
VTANLAVLDPFFERWADRFTWVRPTAGSVGFPRLTAPGVSIDAWSAQLVETCGVLLLPGSLFGMPGDHFRVGFGRTDLPVALVRLESHATSTLR